MNFQEYSSLHFCDNSSFKFKVNEISLLANNKEKCYSEKLKKYYFFREYGIPNV